MAGCQPEYFPVVLSALRGVLVADYNLHGSLATTHSLRADDHDERPAADRR